MGIPRAKPSRRRRRGAVRVGARGMGRRGPAGPDVLGLLRTPRTSGPASSIAGESGKPSLLSPHADQGKHAPPRSHRGMPVTLTGLLCVAGVLGLSALALDLPQRAQVEPPAASATTFEQSPTHDRALRESLPASDGQGATQALPGKQDEATPSSFEPPQGLRTRQALRNHLEGAHPAQLPTSTALREAGWPVQSGAWVAHGEAKLLLLPPSQHDQAKPAVWLVQPRAEETSLRVRPVELPARLGTQATLRLEAPPFERGTPNLLREYEARATVLPPGLNGEPGPRIVEAWCVELSAGAQVRSELRAVSYEIPANATEWVAWIETCLANGWGERAFRAVESAKARAEQTGVPGEDQGASFFGSLTPATFHDALARLTAELE